LKKSAEKKGSRIGDRKKNNVPPHKKTRTGQSPGYEMDIWAKTPGT